MVDENELSNDPYARIAELYDLEHTDYDDDIDLYLNFANSTGGPVLELGCGTGRLILPIANAGIPITGLDVSQPMLARATKRILQLELESLVTLHEGSMTEADEAPGGPFSLAIIALNSFMHIDSAEDQRRTLQAVYHALDTYGRLIIDLPNLTPEALREFEGGLALEGTWITSDGTRIDKVVSRQLFPANQTIQTDLWYDQTSPDGELRRTATTFTMRYLHCAELALLLELSGFTAWQFFGNYDLDSYDDQSERLIVVAEKGA